MLTKINKEKANTVGEEHLNEILEGEFFSLWTYPSVYTDEGITKNKVGKELCDALIVFNNDIFIFSEKSISFNPNINIDTAWGRWKRAAIKKSYDQLVGAKNFIESYPDRIYLDKKCTQPFPLNLKNRKYTIHLISIATGIYNHCQNYFNKVKFGSSGSLMTYKIENYDKNSPFIINTADYKKFFHVFDSTTFKLLINTLGSISDLIDYIKKRSSFFENQKIISIPGEEDLLAIYLDIPNQYGFGTLDINKIHSDRALRITEYHWAEFIKTQKYAKLQHQLKSAAYWNYLTKNISDAICEGVVAENINAPLEAHEIAVRMLAAENRSSKAALGYALTYKATTVPDNRRSAIVVKSKCNNYVYFTILIYPYEEKDGDYNKHREKRAEYMNMYGLVSKFKFPEAKYIIVLATDNITAPLKSEAVLALNYPKDLTREERTLARRVMTEENILNKMKIKSPHPYKNKRKPVQSDTVIIDPDIFM